jgi:hypothetical protein
MNACFITVAMVLLSRDFGPHGIIFKMFTAMDFRPFLTGNLIIFKYFQRSFLCSLRENSVPYHKSTPNLVEYET